ncbi:hypothetical protein [Coxiella endosymbiont of Ornithodoros maritimus]|uniref:hypothetical protein n=1 Tax=Coxiella endosymbiont of Ornithodoros maritimus TaxID=1656172 RepID=UPI0022648CAF|nr:hypothetical protein [Coxiella endosymbiont of Ornithodoros maritimus]
MTNTIKKSHQGIKLTLFSFGSKIRKAEQMAIQHGFDLILKTNYQRFLILLINMLSTFKKHGKMKKLLLRLRAIKQLRKVFQIILE